MFPIEDHHTLTKKGIAQYVAQQGGTERPVSQHDLQVIVHHTLDCISDALAEGARWSCAISACLMWSPGRPA